MSRAKGIHKHYDYEGKKVSVVWLARELKCPECTLRNRIKAKGYKEAIRITKSGIDLRGCRDRGDDITHDGKTLSLKRWWVHCGMRGSLSQFINHIKKEGIAGAIEWARVQKYRGPAMDAGPEAPARPTYADIMPTYSARKQPQQYGIKSLIGLGV